MKTIQSRLASLLPVLLILLSVLTPAAAADSYEVDTGHSTILFNVNHLGFSMTYGLFTDFEGAVVIDEENLANSTVSIKIASGSVTTHNEGRDKHVKSPDFLNVKEFPAITFKSDKVSVKDDTYTVHGNFTMRGVTKPISVTMHRMNTGKDPWGKIRTGFLGEFTVKRGDFGVAYMPEGIGEDVTITLSIECIKNK